MPRLVRYGLQLLRNKVAILGVLCLPLPLAAQDSTVLALGDSLTQGYGLVEQDGFVPQLTAWLAARDHDVRVINGGVSGDTTAGGLARVEWSLTEDVDAMIVALGGNDLLRGIAPQEARKNIRGILDVAQNRGLPVLLIGMQAPSNYGAAYKAEFDALYPELAEEFDALYLPHFFAGLMENDSLPDDLSAVMQDDGIHPNAKGVALIVDAVGPAVETLIMRATDPRGVSDR